MKRLAEDMSDEMKASSFGSSFKGFNVFAVLFSVVLIAVPVAHGLLFL
jgi:hypothetical protein